MMQFALSHKRYAFFAVMFSPVQVYVLVFFKPVNEKQTSQIRSHRKFLKDSRLEDGLSGFDLFYRTFVNTATGLIFKWKKLLPKCDNTVKRW